LDWTQYQTGSDQPERWREPINGLYTDLITIYGAPITTMLAIMFAKRAPGIPRGRGPFVSAILLSSVWNLFLLFQISRLAVFQAVDIHTLTDLMGVVRSLSFLTNPVLAFYFSSGHS
jgi:hypothetical protein